MNDTFKVRADIVSGCAYGPVFRGVKSQTPGLIQVKRVLRHAP